MPIYTTPARQGTFTRSPLVKGEPIKFCCESAGSLTSWTIAGAMQQDSVPSPDSPVVPQECGDRTANLFDGLLIGGHFTSANFDTAGDVDVYKSIKVFLPAGTYVFSWGKNVTVIRMIVDGAYTQTTYTDISSQTITSTTDGYVGISFRDTTSASWDATTPIMLNSGSTALPYEPFGVKIPLSLSHTPIYLDEPIRRIGDYADTVSSDGTVTRRIKKLVLTGEEDWYYYENATGTVKFFYLVIVRIAGVNLNGLLNTHGYNTYEVTQQSGNTIIRMYAVSDGMETIDAFKTFLAAQYANGTPVTVWYVLANATTSTFTAPTLTTAKGSNTLTVGTELQPSSVSITVPNIYPAITKIPITGTNKEVKHVLDPSGNYVYKSPQYYTWDGIRKIVRAGLAPQYYPLGSIIYDNFDPSTGTAFQVVAYDNHFDPALTAAGYTHSMTLCELLIDNVISMDAIEAFLYTNQALPAGTYKFTIPNYDASYGGNKTYYFASTAELPANSQLVMSWPYNQTPKTVTGYAPTASLTSMENTTAATGWNALTLTEWVDGTSPTATDLGTIAGPTTQAGTSSYGSMNHIHRARYGSNNYLQSGARQYLNSDKAANSWWKPQTMFDRPYDNRTLAGKLTKLSPSFVDVLAKPKIQSRTNSYFETTSIDGTTFSLSTNYNIQTDRLFLLSPMEIGFSTTDTTVGTLMGYYQGATDAKRIKYRKSNGNAYYWWLRTPGPSTGNSFRYVNMTGSLRSLNAINNLGLPAAACIQ